MSGFIYNLRKPIKGKQNCKTTVKVTANSNEAVNYITENVKHQWTQEKRLWGDTSKAW